MDWWLVQDLQRIFFGWRWQIRGWWWWFVGSLVIFDGLPSGNLDVQHVYIHNYVYICIINIYIYVNIYIYTYISKLLIFIDDQSQTCFASNKIEGLSFPWSSVHAMTRTWVALVGDFQPMDGFIIPDCSIKNIFNGESMIMDIYIMGYLMGYTLRYSNVTCWKIHDYRSFSHSNLHS